MMITKQNYVQCSSHITVAQMSICFYPCACPETNKILEIAQNLTCATFFSLIIILLNMTGHPDGDHDREYGKKIYLIKSTS